MRGVLRSVVISAFSVGVIGGAREAQAQVRGWVGASATVSQPATDQIVQTHRFPFRLGTFSATVTYPVQGGTSFDIGGGVLLHPWFGVGVALAQFSNSQTATIDFEVPPPFGFNRSVMASGPSSGPIGHKERAVHIEARGLVNLRRASVAVFGGPSHIGATRDNINNFSFRETVVFPVVHTVELTGSESRSVKASGWGMHVGGDVAYFLTERVGLGFVVRFSRADVRFPNDLPQVAILEVLELGTVAAGAGVRLRF